MVAEIVNHLWQSSIFAVALIGLVRCFRNNGAHVRYWLLWIASVKFLVPFAWLALVGSAVAPRAAAVFAFGPWSVAFGRIAQPMPATELSPAALALLGAWGCGTLAVSLVWWIRARRLAALLRTAAPTVLPDRGPIREVKTSEAVMEPALVGIVRPVLLLPRGLTEHLTPPQLAAVIDHEICHWMRRDNLTAAVHMAVESIFWFHPLVWWLGARLLEERERACDEAVLQAGHDRLDYAEAILRVCERFRATPLPCATGIGGASLTQRMTEIARNRAASLLSAPKRLLLAVGAVAFVLGPVAFGFMSGRAMAQSAQEVIPLVRIAPVYPAEALANQLEGSVRLQYTVTAEGAVENVRVLESTSPEFEEPAIDAVRRWRYAPRMENGRPVERPGVMTVIRFKLNAD